jgi:lipopolysaccharide/colanic/teichoic acid biosynthesis glycosyltransferase
MAEENIGQVVLQQFYLSKEQSNQIIRAAQRLGCRVRIYNDLNSYYDHPVTVDQEGEYTFFTLEDEPLENPVNRIKKRCLDIAVSLPVVLFLLPPLTILVAILQQIQSPGPIFYPQLRSGINKRRFNIWKFRTMNTAAQTKEQEKIQAKSGDARIYPFGRFLRRTSLDEVPQFINVLFGEMSVSGPRPHMIEHDEQFAKLLRNYYSRHYVKPGITGLAQSKGFRGEISELSLLEKRVGYDMIYINQWSLLLDIKILFATARQVVFPPKTAY